MKQATKLMIYHAVHYLGIIVVWVWLSLIVMNCVGCSAANSQSPPVSTDKQVIVNVKGNNNVIIIEYKQATDVELGGGNSTNTEQESKLDFELDFPGF